MLRSLILYSFKNCFMFQQYYSYAPVSRTRLVQKSTSPGWRTAGVLGLSIALFCTACSGDAGPKVYPVSGKVTFQGKPTPGALIILHPLNNPDPDARRPLTRVSEDGSFQLTTFEMNDGAPAGEYAVAITWVEDIDMQEVSTENQRPLKNFLPERYGNPESSGLTVVIKEEPNELPPFELTK